MKAVFFVISEGKHAAQTNAWFYEIEKTTEEEKDVLVPCQLEVAANVLVVLPALRFKVLHSRVSLVGCKDGNLLAIRSFSGWNDFILWKKNIQVW